MIVGVQPHILIRICIYIVGQGGSFSVVMSHLWYNLFAADGRAVHTCSVGMQLPRDAEQVSSLTPPLGTLEGGPQTLFVLAGPASEQDANDFPRQRPPGHLLLRFWFLVVCAIPTEVSQAESECREPAKPWGPARGSFRRGGQSFLRSSR